MRRISPVMMLTVWIACVGSLTAQETTDKTPPPRPVERGPGQKTPGEKAPGEKAPGETPPGETPQASPWTKLFDGTEMKGWEVVQGIDYQDAGKVEIKDGSLVLAMGDPATGIRWTGPFPKTDYEVELEGQRLEGHDFFCGMSFPVGEGAVTLILGGWGGWMTGLSCVDGYRAVDNQTCSSTEFKNQQWYRIRVKVTKKEVSAYVDDHRICALETEHHKLTVTSEMEPCLPFGIATWVTTGALRNIRYRPLPKDLQAIDQDAR